MNDGERHQPPFIMATVEVRERGGIQMIIVMASLIIYGDITIAQVPTGSKAAVKTRLATLGYDENGTPLKIEE